MFRPSPPRPARSGAPSATARLVSSPPRPASGATPLRGCSPTRRSAPRCRGCPTRRAVGLRPGAPVSAIGRYSTCCAAAAPTPRLRAGVLRALQSPAAPTDPAIPATRWFSKPTTLDLLACRHLVVPLHNYAGYVVDALEQRRRRRPLLDSTSWSSMTASTDDSLAVALALGAGERCAVQPSARPPQPSPTRASPSPAMSVSTSRTHPSCSRSTPTIGCGLAARRLACERRQSLASPLPIP